MYVGHTHIYVYHHNRTHTHIHTHLLLLHKELLLHADLQHLFSTRRQPIRLRIYIFVSFIMPQRVPTGKIEIEINKKFSKVSAIMNL